MGQGASSQLFAAAATGDLEIATRLLDGGVDVNSVEEVGIVGLEDAFPLPLSDAV